VPSAVAALVAALAVAPGAARIEVAVVDTGANISIPAIAAHAPSAYDVRTGSANVADANGHGTFVTSIVAVSSGNARILVVKAGSSSGAFTDSSEAAAIRYAVDHGARIVNLSIGGPSTSPTERAAVRYAVEHGALVVAAAGNDHGMGNPVEYPAALLQPVGSRGAGGTGLVVAATDGTTRAPFSGSGSWISLAAPGVDVAGVLRSGQHVRQSGTSFSAAEVSGAAALVWAADPALTARQLAVILELTASGHGTWNAAVGYGVVDVAAAVARARRLARR
jgi:subtilisin family serine protease